MIRLGIVDGDANFRRRLEDAARRAGDIDVVASEDHDGPGEAMIRSGGVDVALVELSSATGDGFPLLRRLVALPPHPAPKLVVTAPLSGEDELAEAVALGADYAVLKPCRIETLLERIRQLGKDESPAVSRRRRRRRERVLEDAAGRLHRIGVAPHLKGYRYLVDAVGFVVHDPTFLHHVTSRLYPTVARRHGTTPSRVERAIRNAVEVTLTRGDLEEIERLFGHLIDPAKGKLSNSSFIAQLADHIRIELGIR